VQALTRRLAASDRRPLPDRPIPISLVITDLDVGGAERALVALATRLDRRRWQPSVIALSAEGPLAVPLRQAGLHVECLGVRPGHPIQAVARLAIALRKQRPALVQSFLFHANFATKLAAPWAGRPWVIGGIRVAERRKGWHLQLDRMTARMSTGAVCVSQGVLRFSRDIGGIPAGRLVVIPNGIDPRPYEQAAGVSRESLGVPDHAQLILYVGRLDVQKGVAYLLDAAEKIAAERNDWYLALAGDGAESEPLRRRVAEQPSLAARVHWLGRRDDVPALLNAADLVVLPSLWEGMPNVVLEAMAAGRAVVATAVEGSEELIVPGRTGWLVPAQDSEALRRALLEAADHPERRRAFGEAGRRLVEAEYTQERVVLAYEHLWAGILGLEPVTANETRH
jgi:starch synthase (maltosyl-transferring)